MVYSYSYNYSYWSESKPTNITRGPHIAPLSSFLLLPMLNQYHLV